MTTDTISNEQMAQFFQAQESQPPQQSATRTNQTNITWKGENKAIFQAAYEEWSKDQPKTANSMGDFVIALIKYRETHNAAIVIETKLESLGIKELVDMHKRRMDADARMIAQIADMINDAKAKAESNVRAEMDILTKSRTSLEKSLETTTQEMTNLRTELESLKNDYTVLINQKAENDSKCEQLQSELITAREKIVNLTASNENAASQLEKEKLSSISLKENAVNHSAEINELTKKANDLETVHQQEMVKATATINELTSKAKELQAENGRLQAKMEKLQTVRDAKENINEQITAELAETKMTIARLETKLEAQKDTIKSLNTALKTVQSFTAPTEQKRQKNGKIKEQDKPENDQKAEQEQQQQEQ